MSYIDLLIIEALVFGTVVFNLFFIFANLSY